MESNTKKTVSQTGWQILVGQGEGRDRRQSEVICKEIISFNAPHGRARIAHARCVNVMRGNERMIEVVDGRAALRTKKKLHDQCHDTKKTAYAATYSHFCLLLLGCKIP